jgi:hypothetical protein
MSEFKISKEAAKLIAVGLMQCNNIRTYIKKAIVDEPNEYEKIKIKYLATEKKLKRCREKGEKNEQ